MIDAAVCEQNGSERGWDSGLVPIYDLSNGDYHCFRASEGAASAVYFIRHEDDRIERVADSFAEWINDEEHFT
jgi:hypothetical protein